MTEVYDDRYNKSESATRYIKQRVTDIAPTLDSDDDNDSDKKPLKLKPAIWTSVVAGGIAGVVVDFTLYPLDTFKTRLQAKDGFRSSGGFRKVYKGILPVLLCSAPLSALFFCVYNTMINSLRSKDLTLNPFVYLVAASTAETLCGTVRVPLEIIKQRKQTSSSSAFFITKQIINREGFGGFYRGFTSTIMREVPFACIQYPLWEYILHQLIISQNGEELNAFQTAYCGAAAGAVAAICTTPVDVIKTRIMLADKQKIDYYRPWININFAREVYFTKGLKGFFAGVVPRTLWITLGGFIYFGTYEKVKLLIEHNWHFKADMQNNIQIPPSNFEEEMDFFCSIPHSNDDDNVGIDPQTCKKSLTKEVKPSQETTFDTFVERPP